MLASIKAAGMQASHQQTTCLGARIAWLVLFLPLLYLGGCSTTPDIYAPSSRRTGIIQDGPPDHLPIDLARVANAVPKPEKLCGLCLEPYEVNGKTYRPLSSGVGYRKTGTASWYGKKFHGQFTSTGEPYNMFAMTAAHCTLPLPSYAEVTNLENGKKIIVKVNDRGPFVDDRLLDLSYVAALKLDIVANGRANVLVRAIDLNQPQAFPAAPAATPELLPSGGGFLQIGAFAQRPNAERMLKKLRSSGIANGAIVRARVGNNWLYRVQVGPVPRAELNAASARLKFMGYLAESR